MNALGRRGKLLKILRERQSPVSGGDLAEQLGVSRQVIVQDVALLRANGEDILATPQGYIHSLCLRARPKRVFAVIHRPEEIEEELRMIMESGGKILDVIVEHPLYGELKGLLMITNEEDLQEFLSKKRATGAEPLAVLTRGIHLHTVEADDEGKLADIARKLKGRGFLLQEI